MSNHTKSLGYRLYTGEKSFDFVHNWKRNLGIGVALCLISVALLGIFKLNPGIEFRGGSEFRVSDVSNVSTHPGIEVVERNIEGEAPKTNIVGGDSVRIQAAKADEATVEKVRTELAEAYDVEIGKVTSNIVGPSWGAGVTDKALTGLFVFLILVAIVISLYFRTIAMAVGALTALVHDLLITVGVFAATGFEVTPASVIGFLTILGYSLYDTVVVFDKVRENTLDYEKDDTATFAEKVNLAVNQTLVRSINTSIVALLPVASILFIGSFLLGAGTLRDIALALFVGMLVGTYSSIFVAPATFTLIHCQDKKIKAHTKKVLALREQGDDEELETSGAPNRVAPGKQREQPKRK